MLKYVWTNNTLTNGGAVLVFGSVLGSIALDWAGVINFL